MAMPSASEMDLRKHIDKLQSLNEQISELKQDAPPVYLRVKMFKHKQKLADLEAERSHEVSVIRTIAELKLSRFAFGGLDNDPAVMVNQLLDVLGPLPDNEVVIKKVYHSTE